MDYLRKELDKLHEPNTKRGFDLQKNIIEGKLKQKYNHKIKHSKYCECKFPTLQMCFSFAFGIPDKTLLKNKFNYKKFVKFLKDKKILKQDNFGKLIIYGKYPFSNFEHAGLKSGKRVISKWGLGHIWEHNTNEVPKQYRSYKYYKLPSKQVILKALKEYSNKCRKFAGKGKIC